MSEVLQEYVASGGQRLRVDRAAGIIRGVKLLGLASRNGRRYREAALADAAGLYEGAKVNINHPKGHPLSPRDYQDRLGMIRGVQFRAGHGLFGDLHFNPKHALSEQLVWDAEHAPQNVGLSHNVLARTTRSGEEIVVEEITNVQSIDLVADPASTAGLFEHAEKGTPQEHESDSRWPWRRWSERQGRRARKNPQNGTAARNEDLATAFESIAAPLATLTLDELRRDRPDLVRELQREYERQLEHARQQLDTLMAKEAASRRREQIRALLEEHGLPAPSNGEAGNSALVSPQFIGTLMRAGDEASLRRLIEERVALVRSACQWRVGQAPRLERPRSRDQLAMWIDAPGRPCNAAEFAAAVRGR